MVDIAAADPRTILAVRRQTLGYVSQFLRVVPRVPALDVVAEVLLARGVAPADAADQARSLLLRLNISRTAARDPAGDLLRRRAAAGQLGARLYRRPADPAAGRTNRVAGCRKPLGRDRDDTRGKASGTAIVAICHDTDVRDAIADRLFTVTPFQDAA